MVISDRGVMLRLTGVPKAEAAPGLSCGSASVSTVPSHLPTEVVSDRAHGNEDAC